MNIRIKANKSKDPKIINLRGSKSITIRALFCAFLAETPSRIINPSICDDVLATIDSLKKLGAKIILKDDEILVLKRKIVKKDKFKINVKSSATLLRFIIPLFLVMYPNTELIVSMNEDLLLRPLDGFDRLFEENRIQVIKKDNKLIIQGEISAKKIYVDGSKSSQFLSGILLALPKRNIDTILVTNDTSNSKSYIDMTLQIMKYFNVDASLEFVKGNQKYIGNEVNIECDYSNAALLFVMALHKNKTTFNNLFIDSIQADSIILKLLESSGTKFEIAGNSLTIYESTLKGFNLDINNCIDLAPVLFAVATQCTCESVFTNLKRLEYKESNRLNEMLYIFDILGVKYKFDNDALYVYPSRISYDELISCPKDHRIIHALMYLASVNEFEMELTNIESINKSDHFMLSNIGQLVDLHTNKPQVLISIKSLDDLNIKADGYVMGYKKFTLFASNYFTFAEIKKASKCAKIFVLLNALIHQNKLDEFKKEVDKLCELDISFIVQDVGALHYLESKIDSRRIIFNPYTLICQQDELNAYLLNSNVTLGISNEITIKDTYDTLKTNKCFLLAFGYAPMYQSYRKVLSLYEEYINRNYKKDGLYLKEATRDEYYHINENRYGTVIFRPYILSYLENYTQILNAKYLFLDSNYIPKNIFKKVVGLTNKILDGCLDEKDVLLELNKLNLNIEDGFKYQDSIYKEKSL